MQESLNLNYLSSHYGQCKNPGVLMWAISFSVIRSPASRVRRRKRVRRHHHAAKTKFLTIPTAISGIVAIEDDAAVCKEIIESSIREILVELSSQIDAGFGKEERE